jgi:hypothetical protein
MEPPFTIKGANMEFANIMVGVGVRTKRGFAKSGARITGVAKLPGYYENATPVTASQAVLRNVRMPKINFIRIFRVGVPDHDT